MWGGEDVDLVHSMTVEAEHAAMNLKKMERAC